MKHAARWAIVIGVVTFAGGCSVRDVKEDPLFDICHNGAIDDVETDVDCGGGCGPCAMGKSCKFDADCTTNTCLAGRCDDPSCRNHKQDNAETDVDCGGGTCPACKATAHCTQTSDCADGNRCVESICYSVSCTDGKRNNAETDVDCGGDQCPACAALKSCSQTSDCRTNTSCLDKVTHIAIDNSRGDCGDAGVCSSPGMCYASACKNGNRDGTETDTDCGGEACPACETGKGCLQNSDCGAGNICLNRLCYIATCADGRLDGSETDKDCGGPQCPQCIKGQVCIGASDCEANTPCTNGKCGDPTCFDRQQEPTETDVDCGGSCAPCGLNKKCLASNDCETSNCNNGLCAPPTCVDKNRNQGESDVDCGDLANSCVRCATGAACTDNANCESNHCVGGYCAAARCDDSILNGKETATDCGGGCPKRCPDGSPCVQVTDCSSSVCKAGVCSVPSCSDGVSNGKETGVDCGGSCLPQTCANGQVCASNSDCTFGNCAAGICQQQLCANGQFDIGSETDKDCGGLCQPCVVDQNCLTDPDCQSKVCDVATKKCAPPTCTDRAQNGNETDLNCGGATCTQRCGTGQKCLASSDCDSKVCEIITGRCLAPTCDDAQRNGSETGPDCGGACALTSQASVKTCGTGLSCNVDDDCTSKNCCTAATCGAAINTCVAAECTDGKKNKGETGIDCGGDGATSGCQARCPPGQGCHYNTDCDSGVCKSDNNTCAAALCDDNVKNGTETGKDCGSVACSKPCPDGTPCTGPGDCMSGVCALDSTTNAVTCAAPKCDDKVQNGSESALDCGGNCPNRCGLGQGCDTIADCDTKVANIECINLKCSMPSCKDKAVGGGETDVDCGGSCDKCADTLKCKVDSDCISNHCDSTLHCAAASCSDQRQNQGESGQDCGGTSPCAKCGTNFGCTQKSDCINLVCGPNNLCLAPTCSDGVQNQDETDLDCGGANCRASKPCDSDVGKRCVVNADCRDQWCTTQTGVTGTVCVTPVCGDGKQNGSETDLDCGGNCATKCSDTKGCLKDADCVNGWCNSSGKCATPACTDGGKNGTETGADCGGNCAASCATAYDSNCKQCADNSGCSQNTDCKSLHCTSYVCTVPSGATPAACVGKVLDGTSCGQCDTTLNVNPTYCRAYLWCMYTNSCDPGQVGSLSACADSAKNGVCSVNKINKTQGALEAAINAYRCACP